MNRIAGYTDDQPRKRTHEAVLRKAAMLAMEEKLATAHGTKAPLVVPHGAYEASDTPRVMDASGGVWVTMEVFIEDEDLKRHMLAAVEDVAMHRGESGGSAKRSD